MGRLATAIRSFVLGESPSRDPALAALFGGTPAASGISVNEHTALNLSAVWAAVQIISGSIASLPLILYKRLPEGGKDRFDTHPLYRLLHDQSNPEMSSMVFRETLQAHVLTWGNAYAEIQRNAGAQPVALWPLTPDRVQPFRDNGGSLLYRVRLTNGRDGFLAPDDVLHIRGLGWDGILGYSVIRKARESIALGLATERFGGTFFGQAARPGGILEHPGRLSEEAVKRLRSSWEEVHAGAGNAHRVAVLEEGMRWHQMGIPPDDAQFLQTRLFQIAEIARWFNIPPYKLAELSHATFSNIEHMAISFVTDTLRPWLRRWEEEINRKLISPLERRIQFAEHLVEALMRGDITSTYQALAVGRQWGWLSADDVREILNMNPLPNGAGKMYLVPSNMWPADKVPDPTLATAARMPEPEPEPEPDDERSRFDLDVFKAELLSIVERLSSPAGVHELSAGLERIGALVAQQQSPAEWARAELVVLLQSRNQADQEVLTLLRAIHDRIPAALPAAPDLLPPAQPEREIVEPVQPEPPEDDRKAVARMIAAHRALVLDVVGRMIRRETSKARRAKTPERLRAWVGEFYQRHEAFFVAAIIPAIQTHLGLIRSDQDPGELARRIAADHVGRSRGELHALLDSQPPDLAGTLEDLMAQWETTRPAQIADAVMQEEVAHALR